MSITRESIRLSAILATIRIAEADREPAHRRQRDQRPRALARPQPGDQGTDQEVAEHRVGERHRCGDLGAVEGQQREPEPEQDEQVEVHQPQRAPGVEERRHEQQAEGQPHPGRVDRLGDRAVVAPGERGLDLIVAPGLDRPRRRRRRRSPARPQARRRRSRPASGRRESVRSASLRGSRRARRGRCRWPRRSRSRRRPRARTPAAARSATRGSTSRGGRSPPNGDCIDGSSASAGGAGRASAASAIASAARAGYGSAFGGSSARHSSDSLDADPGER